MSKIIKTITEGANRMLDLNDLINEASLPSNAFSSSGDRDPMVWIKIDRGSSIGGYYRLEKDKWFRSWESPSKGYGIMFREFKVTKHIGEMKKWGENYAQYKISFKYLPTEFDDPADDKSSNWEKTLGWLFIKDDLGLLAKDIEGYIKSQMKNYKP